MLRLSGGMLVRSIVVPLAAVALALSSAAPAAPAAAASPVPVEGVNGAVCSLVLAAEFTPGLSLIRLGPVRYVAKGAISCVGSLAGIPGAVTAGEYTVTGTARGSCLGIQGTETFTAVFTTADGEQHVLSGDRRNVIITPIGIADGKGSSVFYELVPTSGDCSRVLVKSGMLTGQMVVPYAKN